MATCDSSRLPDIRADFFSAAELAALNLPGLPRLRTNISRVATARGWKFRPRVGKGGGREFPLRALPALARIEVLRRRLGSPDINGRGMSSSLPPTNRGYETCLSCRLAFRAE